VNILTVELEHVLDEHGFRHAATSVGDRIGAHRIGAGVYRADDDSPIWPYHYHHGVEELLYVIAGAPVLRDPSGERSLAPGELARFPSGPSGAHTMKGPGRFVIFSTGQHVEPYMSVYPDSDKVSGPEGILLRSGAVGYWHGEGGAGPCEPEDWAADIGPAPPPTRLDVTPVDVQPGAESAPYRFVYGREEWLLVLAGNPTLRHPDGDDRLEEGDLVCFPEGPGGAHHLRKAPRRQRAC